MKPQLHGQTTTTPFVLAIALLMLPWTVASLQAQSSAANFSFPERGGVSFTTSGTAAQLNTGYARINETGAVPAGFAVFNLRMNDALVSEATILAADLISAGRIYAEVGGSVNTGIAISNTGSQAVQIAYYFTDSLGSQRGTNVLTIPPNGKIARFLTEAPFNSGPLLGTFTFFILAASPDTRVSAIALRSFVNERGEFLMTTVPVAPVGQRGSFSHDTLPHFAIGGGWITEVVLVNPADTELAGEIAFIDQAGQPASVGTANGTGSSFGYRVAPRSSWRLRASDGTNAAAGSVRVTSSIPGQDIPVAFLIYSFRSAAGITISTTGVPSPRPTTAARLYVEAEGQFSTGQAGSLQTGIAISNAFSQTPVRILLELTTLSGASTGLAGTLDIPAGGQMSRFLHQIPGLESVPLPFQGVLRVSAQGASVSMMGVRGRYNERREFIMTSLPVVNEDDDYFRMALQYSEFFFPHFADGSGYTTQFVLFSGWTPGSTSGNLTFFTNDGSPAPLSIRAR